MMMFGIAIYEMDKAFKSSKKTNARLDAATTCSEQFKTKIDVAKTDLNRIKTLQQNNRKDLDQLNATVFKLEQQLAEKLKLLDAKINNQESGSLNQVVQVRDPEV